MDAQISTRRTRRGRRALTSSVATLCLGCGLTAGAHAAPGDLTRVSVNSAGVAANGPSTAYDASEGARYVVFESRSTNLDTNGEPGLFIRDRESGRTERVDVSSTGQPSNASGGSAAITPDGRHVVFLSRATNLVANDMNGKTGDIFVRDRERGVTELVSILPDGQQADFGSIGQAAISDDGRYVAFVASGTNIAPGSYTESAVFVRDRSAGTTRRVDVNAAGVPANNPEERGFFPDCDISGDGRFVAFASAAGNLTPNDTNGIGDVFVRDLQTGVIERVSVRPDGTQFQHFSHSPAISADGRFVAFAIADGRIGAQSAVWVRDRWAGVTERVSVSSAGEPANDSSGVPAISADGRYVVFNSGASNLVAGDTNGRVDAFRRDREAGITELVSRTHDGKVSPLGGGVGGISPDGGFVVFTTEAQLIPADRNQNIDVYVYEAGAGPPIARVAYTLKPGSLAFGRVTLGASRTQTFWLRNKSSRALDLTTARFVLAGRDAAQFRLAESCGESLAVDASCPIRVTFRPTSVGDKLAEVRTSIEGVRRTRSVTGTGVSP